MPISKRGDELSGSPATRFECEQRSWSRRQDARGVKKGSAATKEEGAQATRGGGPACPDFAQRGSANTSDAKNAAIHAS
eukprot:6190182-Pleurochrysis_carterae.AAC.1